MVFRHVSPMFSFRPCDYDDSDSSICTFRNNKPETSGHHLDLNLTTVVHSCCLLCATLWVWLLHFAHPANHVGHCLRIHPNTGFLQIFLQTILGHQGRPSFFGGCFWGGQVCEPEDVTLGPFTFEFLNNRGCLFIISDK